MIDGWNITVQTLTYDDREPDAYTIAFDPENIDPDERWVLRRYDEIVASKRIYNMDPDNVDQTWLAQMLLSYGAVVPSDVPAWHEWLLHADDLTARILAQEETLPIAV